MHPAPGLVCSDHLNDAYIHVSILLRHRPFLWFAFEGRAWQYRVLPLGVCLSPRAFTKIVEGALIPLFGRCVTNYIWNKTNTVFYKKNIITAVKNGGGIVMAWGCFAVWGPGWIVIIDGTMNHVQNILKENVQPCLWLQAQAHLGYAAGQWLETHQQVHL